jgi:hypothetical protein
MVIALQQLVPQVELKEMKGDLSFGESGEEISDVRGLELSKYNLQFCNDVHCRLVRIVKAVKEAPQIEVQNLVLLWVSSNP